MSDLTEAFAGLVSKERATLTVREIDLLATLEVALSVIEEARKSAEVFGHGQLEQKLRMTEERIGRCLGRRGR